LTVHNVALGVEGCLDVPYRPVREMMKINSGRRELTSGVSSAGVGGHVEWWQWAVLVLGVLVLLTAVFYGIQTRRRRGGIVAQRSRTSRNTPRGGR
jgi:hypothetical protein